MMLATRWLARGFPRHLRAKLQPLRQSFAAVRLESTHASTSTATESTGEDVFAALRGKASEVSKSDILQRVLRDSPATSPAPTASSSDSVLSQGRKVGRRSLLSGEKPASTSRHASSTFASEQQSEAPAPTRGADRLLARVLESQDAAQNSAEAGPSSIAKSASQLPAYAAPSTDTDQLSGGSSDAQGPEASTEPVEKPAAKFSSLKGVIDYSTYKALTERPFKFVHMSAVQEQVLSLLPELADTKARNAQVAANEAVDTEDANTNAPARRDIATDLLIKAKTGTGKTVAFLVPALEARAQDIKKAEKDFKLNNPQADRHAVGQYMREYCHRTVGTVVLSPTRELATQIANEALRLMSHHGDWNVRLFIGGASRQTQLREFRSWRNRRDIVIATPGRLNDLLSEKDVHEAVSKAKMLIFDEADTLLDMGFKDEIRQIVQQLPPKTERQTFMFSATVSRDIRQIAKMYLKPAHTFIDCVPENESNTHVHIPQYVTAVSDASEQIPHILRLLAQDSLLHPDGGKAVIFLPTTKATQMFAMLLNSMRSALPWGVRGTQVFEMHAQKSQSARDRVSQDFRAARGPGYRVLVTSDVSARGVDYPGVTRVIQIGIPANKEMYVHRVGRTGRAGKEGRGDIILLPFERDYATLNLQDIPLKPNFVQDMQAEVEKLAAEFDAQPDVTTPPPSMPMSRPRRRFDGRNDDQQAHSRMPSIQKPVLPRIQAMAETLKDRVLPMLSEFDINEVLASQLGFYTGHTMDIRATKWQIYEGLRQWCSDGLGAAEPPSIGRSMLTKLGITEASRNDRRFDNGRFGGNGRQAQFQHRDRQFGGGNFGRSQYLGNDRYGDRAPRSYGGDRFGDRAPRSFGNSGGDRYGNSGSDRYGEGGSRGFGFDRRSPREFSPRDRPSFRNNSGNSNSDSDLPY